jgi:glycosyltransferase involved in cell wall biosynthesis
LSVVFDVQGIQSRDHAERGIARYLVELTWALERWAPGRVAAYVLNPTLPGPAPGRLPELGDRLRPNDAPPPADHVLYQVGSPFERLPIDQIWPAWARTSGVRLAVTLYDLIPAIFSEVYLADTTVRRWYTTRLELVRRADRILAISEATASDAVERLGLSPERVVVVGAGVSESFRRAEDPDAVWAAVRSRLPRVEPRFILYLGGIDPRKNIDRLLAAYARLPSDVRCHHQLVVVCRMLSSEQALLERRLRELGIPDRVHFPGFVSDEDLRLLYQATELFVFPSLYEGYGLPVAEAIACGAPVVAARTSSLVELVQEESALFDPEDVDAIASVLERALTDEGLRATLRASRLEGRHTWKSVAERTAAVYDELAELPRRRRRRRRIAFVSPLPPQRSGVADESYKLLEALRAHCSIDAFVEDTHWGASAPPDITLRPLSRFGPAERARGGYDHVVVCLGNSEFHVGALALLRKRPAVVIAHDVRLTGLYAWLAREHVKLEPRGFQGALRAMYGDSVPSALGERGWLDVEEYDRHRIFMAREAISLSERYLVHSEHAAALARADAAPGDEGKVGTLTFGHLAPNEFARYEQAGDESLVSTFGVVAPVKQTEKVIRAFAEVARGHPDARLQVVGPLLARGDRRRFLSLTRSLGVQDRVDLTGEVGDAEFHAAVARTSVAVQLRAASNGESSGTVARCLSAGVPTIVTALGSAAELPDDCVVKVAVDVDPPNLARVVEELLVDGQRRLALEQAGQEYAAARSFARAADELYSILIGMNARAGRAA